MAGGAVETLSDIPCHVWKGLPDCIRLGPSSINQLRIGVWATQGIPKGKRFGPFVGEKKKRSQVTSNIYMWEVYFPTRGWMCVDATDPMKGNWLRYVNWACSKEKQNLFPLEINRAIYYKVLRPIGPGEELLVWYSGEDNPEITAALEEERVSSLNKKNSPRVKRARRKERARLAGLGGFKQTSETKHINTEMWDGEEGPKEDNERPPSPGPSHTAQEHSTVGSTDHADIQDMSELMNDRGNGKVEADEVDEPQDVVELQQLPIQKPQQLVVANSMQNEQHELLESYNDSLDGGPSDPQLVPESASFPGQKPEADPDLDPDGDIEGDPHGESHPCQHCERHFSTKQGLERHIHIHATANQQMHMFQCRYCGKSFGSQVGRRRHERRHESVSKKKPGSLAGTATLLNPAAHTDGSSPDCPSPANHSVTVSSQFAGAPVHNSEAMSKELASDADRTIMEEESKELHPCKYCNKAFGTHTNMRRHQRRIHERHLLPKGVRRKGMLLQELSAQQQQQQQQQQPDQSPSTSPPPVYVASADTEDEVDRDDYVVDISKNISENLSFYIDGKIVSTSSVSSCDVIEVDSRSAALFGLDAVIIRPNQISQTLKAEGSPCPTKQASNIGQPTSKRRTSTPPLIPSLKMETETGSATSSSMSSSSNLIVGGLYPPSTDSLTSQREKTVYLSPKLKQLLQTQDNQKPTISLIAQSHRLASPPPVTSLSGASCRFKRRTASPPSSPQLSPSQKAESCNAEVGSSYVLKVPKVESHSMSPTESPLGKEDQDAMNTSAKDAHNHSASSTGGNSCNQQPLDLSSSVSRRIDSVNKVLGDSALDLSINRKYTLEPDPKGSTSQPPMKKRKPNTSMLEKVLMNEYTGLSSAGEEAPCTLANHDSFQSLSPNMAPESANPSPPSLTPVPSSPGTSSMTSPTPPPPVLPTIPSPPSMPSSPFSQPSDCSASRPLPVLSPKMSPRSIEQKPQSDVSETLAERHQENVPNTPVKDHLNPSSTPSPAEPIPVHSPSTDADISEAVNGNTLHNGKLMIDPESIAENVQCSETAILSECSPVSSAPLQTCHGLYPSLTSPSPTHTVIKEEPDHRDKDLPDMNLVPHNAVASSPHSAAPDTTSEKDVEDSEPFSKTFVCNVCEEPFGSIKELNGHISVHAVNWPYKCEFCVQLFGEAPALLAHRTTLHGVGRIFVCSACSKEFAFLCNLQQHQKDLHPNQTCSHTTLESGKLRPQNYTDPSKAKEESSPAAPAAETSYESVLHSVSNVIKEEFDLNGTHGDDRPEDPTEELYTTIKIMASEGGKPKGPDVRLGINQHYPSFKPPPFPYHSRSHAGSVASATNFTTHNIPQTFTTAIRCTKCGNSFDNMPELHEHILACANASDKKRYTPKKNPIPLKQIVKPQNGSLSSAGAGASAFRRMGQPKRLNFNQEPSGKTKLSALSKKKNQLVQKAISQKNRMATTAAKRANIKVEEQELHICPHCSREFTYPASLSKHVAVSCPMKPVTKKGKKILVGIKQETTAMVEKNMNLRRKATDSDIQQTAPESEPEPRPLGKTRARSYGAAELEHPRLNKGKGATPLGRPKRPASFPASPVNSSKKSKKSLAQSLPPTPLASDTSSDAAPRPAMRMQRVGKEVAPKRVAEIKLPPQQAKKEERALRTRERVGGPVTRSLQMASTIAPTEGKTEDSPIQEQTETQEVQVK